MSSHIIGNIQSSILWESDGAENQQSKIALDLHLQKETCTVTEIDILSQT